MTLKEEKIKLKKDYKKYQKNNFKSNKTYNKIKKKNKQTNDINFIIR